MPYTLITVVTPAKPTGPRPFGSRLPGPFIVVCATGSHLPRLSEALATGTRPIRSRSGIRLLYLGVYGRGAAASMVGRVLHIPPCAKSAKSPKVSAGAAMGGRRRWRHGDGRNLGGRAGNGCSRGHRAHRWHRQGRGRSGCASGGHG